VSDNAAHGVFNYSSSRTREIELVDPPTPVIIRTVVVNDFDLPQVVEAPPETCRKKRDTYYYREDGRRYRSLEAMPRCDGCGQGPSAMFYLPDLPETESPHESSRRVCAACYGAAT
jgi:hypothetical protein